MKIFVTLFSETVKPTKLKLGTHRENRWMYLIHRNLAAAAYLSLYSFFFLYNFQTFEIFVTLFSGIVRPTGQGPILVIFYLAVTIQPDPVK